MAVARRGLAGALERAGNGLNAPQVEAQLQLPSPVRFCQALEALGPTFVKLGQVLATRVDLFGPDWIEQFEKLQSRAGFLPYEVVEQIEELL